MIVQSLPKGQDKGPYFCLKLEEHLQTVGQLSEAFGNDTFAAPEPREEFLYAARWHDKGWKDLDDNPPLNPKSGLPYNLVETPIPVIALTGARSPEYNEAHHAYCGLLDSMHIWGLYNGRYGLSDKVLIDMVPDEHRLIADTMLDTERQRQRRLTADLAADKATAGWVEEAQLFNNYKLLQFFDTFALYFNCTHATQRGETVFPNVPRALGDDVAIRVWPEDEETYGVSPYPFREDGLEISYPGRYLTPAEPGEAPDMAAVMRETPLTRQHARLVAG